MGISRFTAPKGNTKFGILFSLKQKRKSDTFRRQKPFRQIFVYSRMFPPILTYSDIFRHNQIYSGIIQTYSCIFRTMCNRDIFRILAYSEPWHIQNQKHIQNRGIFRILAYSSTGIFRILVYSKPCYIHSEPWYIQSTFKHLRWRVFEIVNG